jgi:hypothetical protein
MSKRGNPSLKVDTVGNSDDGDAPISSLLASWNEIVSQAQINSPVPGHNVGGYFADEYATPPASTQRSSHNRASFSGFSPLNNSTQSSLGDSLDISNADFEVGTIAARKSMEKSNLRGWAHISVCWYVSTQVMTVFCRRRNSIQSPQIGQSKLQAKISASPEIGRVSVTYPLALLNHNICIISSMAGPSRTTAMEVVGTFQLRRRSLPSGWVVKISSPAEGKLECML